MRASCAFFFLFSFFVVAIYFCFVVRCVGGWVGGWVQMRALLASHCVLLVMVVVRLDMPMPAPVLTSHVCCIISPTASSSRCRFALLLLATLRPRWWRFEVVFRQAISVWMGTSSRPPPPLPLRPPQPPPLPLLPPPPTPTPSFSPALVLVIIINTWLLRGLPCCCVAARRAQPRKVLRPAIRDDAPFQLTS